MRPILEIICPDIPKRETDQRNAGGRMMYEITEDFEVVLRLWNGSDIVIASVKRGFLTDLNSTPGWASIFGFRQVDQCEKAAVCHDWWLDLVSRGEIGKPKFLVDLLFLTVLIATGVSFVRAMIEFLGVRTRSIVIIQ